MVRYLFANYPNSGIGDKILFTSPHICLMCVVDVYVSVLRLGANGSSVAFCCFFSLPVLKKQPQTNNKEKAKGYKCEQICNNSKPYLQGMLKQYSKIWTFFLGICYGYLIIYNMRSISLTNHLLFVGPLLVTYDRIYRSLGLVQTFNLPLDLLLFQNTE